MRGAFIQTLVELAEEEPRILLLTGDLGYLALEPFADRFPSRFFNVGVAEQNMLGLATGLAEAGFIPFVYSIVPFAVLRAYEFIRNGPVLHGLKVRIVGVGGGFEYGPNGFTHYGLEDIAVLRALPAMSIFAPADHAQTRTVLKKTWNLPGPTYYRLGKDDRTVVPGLNGRFETGRVQELATGSGLAILVMGSVATEALAAVERLAREGIAVTAGIVASIRPAPTEELAACLSKHHTVMTVEAHYRNGGLGSLVAEIIAEGNLSCRLIRCGVEHLPTGGAGSQAWLHNRHGLSADALVQAGLEALKRRRTHG